MRWSPGGLVALDMDGTLIEGGTSWEVLHKSMGTWKEAEENRRRYMAGEISYDEWFERDVGLWIGRNFEVALRSLDELEPTEGAAEAVSYLRALGMAVGVISSGLDVVLKRVLGNLDFDFVEVNEIKIEGGKVVGWTVRVPFSAKGRIVANLSERFGIPLSSVAVVGDAENDLSMFRLPVGLRVAFRPNSEELSRAADVVVWGSMTEVARVVGEWFRAGRSYPRVVK